MSYAPLFARRALGVRLGLAIVERVHAALGRPAGTTAAVHVVGTNGKGSVAAMVAHGLGGAGRRVGLYTSPHLMRVTERIRVDDAEVDDATLRAAIDRVLAVEAQHGLPRPLSFFEVLTLAGLVVFEDAGVDLVVAEAGLGGRLDATRLVDARVVAVTSIALDHQVWLGSTLEAIAAEKAAVFRGGVPVFSAPQPPAVGPVLHAAADAVGAPLRFVTALPRAPRGLPGAHQRVNAAVALAVARHFEPALGIEALDGVRWPGRLERVVVGPRGGALVLDVAHNPAGMQALVDYVADQPWRDTVTIVFGCAPDKDEPAMLEVLRSLQRPLWWVPPAGPERSDGRTDRPAGDDDDRPRPQPRGIARRFAEPEDPRLVGAVSQRLAAGDTVVVCGSHLVVGPLRTHFVEPQRGTVRPDPSDPRAGGA